MNLNRLSDEVLVDYASGAAPEPVALAIATHMSLNAEARRDYEQMNHLGGALLMSLDEEAVSDHLLDDLLARLDEPEAAQSPSPAFDAQTKAIVPQPLLPYLRASLDDLPWQKVYNGVEEYRFETTLPGYKSALLRIAPGKPMPLHSHRGPEYTVVLDGAYYDQGVRLGRGDLCEADGHDQHRPIADDKDGCLCLIVLDAPIRLSGLLGIVLNPFLKN